MKQSFQDGVNTIYNKIVSCGVTPSDRTPTGCANGIQSIYTNRYTEGYNNGRIQGQNDVKNNPNGYGLYTQQQYDQNYTNGYNAGYSAGQGSRSISFTIQGVANSPSGDINYWNVYANDINVSAFNTISFSNFVGANEHNSSGTIFVTSGGTTLVNNSSTAPSPINISGYSSISIRLQARYSKTISIRITLS